MKTNALLLFLFIPCFFQAQDIFEAARKGNIKRAEFLITLNTDTLNAKNEAGFTPLILASYYNQIEFEEFLLLHHADVNTDSPEGPAILAASYKGFIEMVVLLLKYKANINAQNEQGTTALIYAALNGNKQLVDYLLKNGANKDLTEKSGKTALSYATLYNNQALIQVLSKK